MPYLSPVKKLFCTLKFSAKFLIPAAILLIGCTYSCNETSRTPQAKEQQQPIPPTPAEVFTPPDTATIPHDTYGNMVRYGREIIINTAYYLGPNGTKGHYLGNTMTCTNCHLDAGTRPFTLNYFSAHARYPQFRGRENKILTLGDRINNCIERPHNGRPMPLNSKEMVAMLSYMKWLATAVPVAGHVNGDDGLELNFPTRAADLTKGAALFTEHCVTCHGADGQGQMNPKKTAYAYPPLWGANSYQKGSSPHRVLKQARFLKACMPHKKASWDKPFLTDEQAIDIAAFINDDRIHDRPEKADKTVPDYPDINVKPIDFGTGPYVDTFSERQHKYGPFQPIINYHKQKGLPVIF